MTALPEMTEFRLPEALIADLARFDVVRRAGLIRRSKDPAVPPAERESAETLKKHYEGLLGSSRPVAASRSTATWAAVRDPRVQSHTADPARLQTAIGLLDELVAERLTATQAKDLLDCIADIEFGTPSR